LTESLHTDRKFHFISASASRPNTLQRILSLRRHRCPTVKSTLTFLFICWASPLVAEPLVIVEGGVSPDKRLAVAVVPQKDGEFIDEADTTVYLIDNNTKKPIGPLEEADSGGGTWGTTTKNVSALWSPDSHFLAINMRTGRLMHDFVLYEIIGRRARPQNLPDSKSHPKGKIYEQLDYTANPGQVMTAWLSPRQFIAEEYGLRPRDIEKGVDGSKFGLADFDGGSLEMLFSFRNGQWMLDDIRTPKEKVE
jgi:hypothetical protein